MYNFKIKSVAVPKLFDTRRTLQLWLKCRPITPSCPVKKVLWPNLWIIFPVRCLQSLSRVRSRIDVVLASTIIIRLDKRRMGKRRRRRRSSGVTNSFTLWAIRVNRNFLSAAFHSSSHPSIHPPSFAATIAVTTFRMATTTAAASFAHTLVHNDTRKLLCIQGRKEGRMDRIGEVEELGHV